MAKQYKGINKYHDKASDWFEKKYNSFKTKMKVAGISVIVATPILGYMALPAIGQIINNGTRYPSATSQKLEEQVTEETQKQIISQNDEQNLISKLNSDFADELIAKENSNEQKSYFNDESYETPKNIEKSIETPIKNTNQLEDYVKLGQVIYGEAANQPEKARRIVAKVALNRVGRQGYKSTLDGVLYEYNGFSCTGADMNKTWKQAIGELPMNEYEKKVYQQCLEDAKYVLSGNKIGVKDENEIVAYHDARVHYSKLKTSTKHGPYWRTLEHVDRLGNLEVYKTREK